jgi:hypothetical protein
MSLLLAQLAGISFCLAVLGGLFGAALYGFSGKRKVRQFGERCAVVALLLAPLGLALLCLSVLGLILGSML